MIATRNHRPAYELRPTGYVTETMIRKHGSFKAALEHLNAASQERHNTPRVEAARGREGA